MPRILCAVKSRGPTGAIGCGRLVSRAPRPPPGLPAAREVYQPCRRHGKRACGSRAVAAVVGLHSPGAEIPYPAPLDLDARQTSPRTRCRREDRIERTPWGRPCRWGASSASWRWRRLLQTVASCKRRSPRTGAGRSSSRTTAQATKFGLTPPPAASVGRSAASFRSTTTFRVSDLGGLEPCRRQGRTATGDWLLYSTPISGQAAIRICQPMTLGGGVEHGISLALDGNVVRYLADPWLDERYFWFLVPFVGGRSSAISSATASRAAGRRRGGEVLVRLGDSNPDLEQGCSCSIQLELQPQQAHYSRRKPAFPQPAPNLEGQYWISDSTAYPSRPARPGRKVSLDDEAETGDPAAQTLDELRRGAGGAAGGDDVVDDQHALAARRSRPHGLQPVGAVLELVGLRRSSPEACRASSPGRNRR